MQKPRMWPQRDGVALVGPDQHVNPATKIDQCVQKARARHAHAKYFVLDHPVSRPKKSARMRKHANESAQTQGTPTYAAGCMLQRMQRHRGVRSQRRGMRCWRRSGAGGNTLTSRTQTYWTKKTVTVSSARPIEAPRIGRRDNEAGIMGT